MCKIIAVSNGKGGCGKTTTSWNLCYNLSIQNYKVLGIDMDQQGSLSLSNKCKDFEKNVYTMIKNEEFCPIEISENFYMIPSSSLLGDLFLEFSNRLGKELILSDILEAYSSLYDYIIIDCPPQFTLLADMAYTAADCVLVPVSTGMYSVDGLVELNKRVRMVKRLFNPNIRFGGILITNSKTNTNSSKNIQAMANEAKSYLDTFVYTTIIRSSTVVDDAQDEFKPLYQFKKNADVTKDYLNFTNEFLEVI